MVSTAALNPALDQPVEEKPLAALVSRISQGDERALGTLYDNTGGMVYGLTLRVVGDPACAEDITLEVLSPGLAHCTKLQPARGSVSAWLVTLVRSRAIDWLRSRKARSAEVTEPIDDVHELQDKRASPEVASMDASRAQAVREAMASLPEEQRKLIELAYFSGLSHNEIARNMALPLGTMKSRIRLGALHMRESLGPYTEELRRTRRRSTREACTTSHPCMRSMCWVRKIESDSSGIWSPVALNARQKSVPSAMSRFIWRTRWRLSLPANYGTGSCRRRKVPLARRAFLFESNGLLIAGSSEMAWKAMAPGIRVKRLYFDQARRYDTSLVHMDAGAHYPSHRHKEIEELFVLSGDLHVEGEIMQAGDYCRADASTLHGETFTDSGCTFLLRASPDNEVLA